jgi:RNA polymerase sigma-70 factor (ECF subfamily)
MIRQDGRLKFDEIVKPQLPDAFALARWLTSNRTDAEDVVQEACLRAFQAIDTFNGGSARAWVLTIVRRTAYSWLSKNRRPALVAISDLDVGERTLVEIGGDEKASNKANPEAELIAKADATRLESAITSLPLPFREAFVLRDVHGLDYREIAEVTGVPLGTVMSRLARARRRLVELVGRDPK